MVIAAALSSPRRLGLPFAAWTLDRLAASLLEHKVLLESRQIALTEVQGPHGPATGWLTALPSREELGGDAA